MAGFIKAKKEQVWLKVLLSGASGSGKSYSALRVAKGIADKCGSRIAYIGTEGSRNKYYASSFDYDLLELEDPFTIDKYVEAIDMAIDAGYKVLIIDSLTHEWLWLNDTHDKMPGNSFQNWGKLKPKHREFMDKILTCPIHIIATSRSKDEWVLETDSKGRQVPRKVGLGSQQDKNITYEYTVSLVIEQDTHIAHADKDNTKIFDSRYDVLTEKDGEALYAWANDSDIPPTVREPKKYEEVNVTVEDELTLIKKEIIALCTQLGGTKNSQLMETLASFVPSKNPNAIRSIDKARECLAALKGIKPIE
jgi:hypothetical protein